ncbi:MFS transporter [Halobacteriaceae archaeon GCM10025711]
MDWQTTMFIAAGVLFVSGGLFYLYGPENTTPGSASVTDGGFEVRGRIKALLTVGFLFVLGIYLLQGTYHRGAVVFIPDYLQAVETVGAIDLFGREIPPSRWVYSFMLMVGVGGQLLGGYLDERFDTEAVIAVQLLATAGILSLLGRTTGLALFGAIALFGVSISVLAPILQNLVARHTSESERGLAYGVTSAGGTAAGGFLGSSLAGWLATIGSYPRMFSALAVIPLAALALVLVYAYRY